MTPRTRPNRRQGGDDPARDALADDAFHVWRRHPARPSCSSAQWQLPSPPSTRQASSRSMPSSQLTAARPDATVRRDDEAPPAGQVGEGVLEPLGDPREHVGHRLAVATAAHVLAAQQRRPAPPASRRPPRRTSGPATRPRGSRGSAGRARPGCRTRAPRSRPSRRARLRSEETIRSGERAATAGPTASACRTPSSESGASSWPCQMPAALWVVSPWRRTTTPAPATRGWATGHRPPCSVPTTPRSMLGQSFQSRSSS